MSNNRIKGLVGATTVSPLKEEYDQRRMQMREKTIKEARMKLHRHMVQEIDKMVPEWRKKIVKMLFPVWLNNAVALVLRCLPPDILVQWAVSPGIHMAYKWIPLLPMVILNSVIRMILVVPLQLLQTRVWLFGIKRDIKQVGEYEVHLTLSRGKESKTWKQDWRYGQMVVVSRTEGNK